MYSRPKVPKENDDWTKDPSKDFRGKDVHTPGYCYNYENSVGSGISYDKKYFNAEFSRGRDNDESKKVPFSSRASHFASESNVSHDKTPYNKKGTDFGHRCAASFTSSIPNGVDDTNDYPWESEPSTSERFRTAGSGSEFLGTDSRSTVNDHREAGDVDEEYCGNLESEEKEQRPKDGDMRRRKHDKVRNTRKERKKGSKGSRRIRRKPNIYEDTHCRECLEKNLSGQSWVAIGCMFLVDMVKAVFEFGFEKISEVAPACTDAGLAVFRYILVLLVLCMSLIISMCVSLFVKIPMFLWDKIKAWKEDYEQFLKRRNTVPYQPKQHRQQETSTTVESSDEVISQLLASRHLNAYDVLGVSDSATATDEEIKRKYREMAKLVHPDKNTHPESGQAFQILQSAFETINTEENREAYQLRRNQEKLEDEFGDFIDLMKQHVNELKNSIFCSVCEKSHPRSPTDRLVSAARYCGQCDIKHSAKDGDVWVETSYMGFKYYCYLCLDDQVFEVTEWASCQGLLRSRANTHAVYISVKSNRSSYSPWDDLFGGEADQSSQSNQNPKKKRNKSKTKSFGKKRR